MEFRAGGLTVSAETWRRIEPVLDAALDIPASARDEFIAQALDGDTASIDMVQKFALDCEQSDPMLDRDAIDYFPALLVDLEIQSMPDVLASRYRIEREIGRGGMAVVFLAEDMTHNRQVAIKVMRKAVATSAGATRFLAEIRTTAGMRHPHIVPLYDSGESDGVVFFVMPYFEEDSLAVRLKRSGRLSVQDTLKIGRDLASGLVYAHRYGLVHRDIKPSNVLFSSGHALLADFGIARIDAQSTASLTATGVGIGTPAYMSPEQCDGVCSIDARSDLYSFGCTLHEMLLGEAPPTAATRAVLAQHGITSDSSLAVSRPDVSRSLRHCIARAMALSADDRFSTTAEMSQALDGCVVTDRPAVTRLSTGSIRRSIGFSISAIIIVALALLSLSRDFRSSAVSLTESVRSAFGLAPAVLDSTRYALIPMHSRTGAPDSMIDDRAFAQQMQKWDSITVVEPSALLAELPGPASAPVNQNDARRAAGRLGAGRFVQPEVQSASGIRQLRTSVFDTRSGKLLGTSSIAVPLGKTGADSSLATAVSRVLFPRVPSAALTQAGLSTHSVPAMQAFTGGVRSFDEWNLARADSQFSAAASLDENFAQAHLWMANIRQLQGKESSAWVFAANRALKASETLSVSERRWAETMLKLAAGDSVGACSGWIELSRGTQDFSSWYSAALCQLRDQGVVRDSKSPSRWRFRTSSSAASAALQHAFQILPAIHKQFRSSWYWELSTSFFTKPTQLRTGRAVKPDTGLFAAYPSWVGDSLVYIPYRQSDFTAAQKWTLPATRNEAVRHQRQHFLEIATTWRSAFPNSADAMLARSIAMDELGDPSSLDSLKIARQLASTDGERLRTAVAEIWLRVKLGIPGDLGSLRVARLLADSLLSTTQNARGREATALASIAALTGRANRAAMLARAAVTGGSSTPASILSPAAALLAFAAVGAPGDSIRALEKEISVAIATLDTLRRPGERMRRLGRPLTLSYPSYQSALMATLAAEGDVSAVIYAAGMRGDAAAVNHGLETLSGRRDGAVPENLKLETVYPESWLRYTMNGAAVSLKHLSPTLDAQRRSSAENLSTVAGSGPLVRAMALRATLAAREGDSATASTWAKAVIALWQSADSALQIDVVAPMTRIVR